MATEKRLIDAHNLWSDINLLPHNGDMISSEEVEQTIAEAPTVDAVEVVRCKDCKHYEWNPFDGCEVCTHISGYVRPDFGCVDGERKDNY